MVHALHRRGGGAQYQQGVILSTAVFCHVAGVVFRDVLRFVGGLLLLVQNQQPQIPQGGEHGGAGTDDHPGLTAPHPLPLVVPLPRPQGRVEHSDVVPEVGGENAQELGGQGDLGHQHHGGTAPGQCLIDQPEIHLGLAAARHPVQQGGSGSSDRRQGVQSLKGRLLLGVEHRGSGPLPRLHRHPTEHLTVFQAQDTALFQRAQGGVGGPGEVTQLLSRGAAEGAQQLGHGIPQGRGAALA